MVSHNIIHVGMLIFFNGSRDWKESIASENILWIHALIMIVETYFLRGLNIWLGFTLKKITIWLEFNIVIENHWKQEHMDMENNLSSPNS